MRNSGIGNGDEKMHDFMFKIYSHSFILPLLVHYFLPYLH